MLKRATKTKNKKIKKSERDGNRKKTPEERSDRVIYLLSRTSVIGKLLQLKPIEFA